MSILKNIVTDYGAPVDGISDAGSAFINFRTFGQAQSDQIILTVPAHTYQLITNSSAHIFDGIKNLIVSGYGATLSDNSGTGAGFNLGSSVGIGHDGTASTGMVATVAAGATSVFLLDISKAALFNVGDWALVTGLDLQGSWSSPGGYPPNPYYSDYVLISGKSGARIDFVTTPLTHIYESTWPRMNSGSGGESDPGGPATIYALDQKWNINHEYKGLTFLKVAQCGSVGRQITFTDCVDNTSGIFPSQNILWQAFGCTLGGTGGMEVDKIIKTMILNTCTTGAPQMSFQNSYPELLTISNSTIVNMSGTPRKLVVTNSTINSLYMGATSFGPSSAISLSNCTLPSVSIKARLDKGPGNAGWNIVATMVNGVIIVPNTAFTVGAPQWAVPGATLFWSGAETTETQFRVIDVTQDATNTYILTNLVGGFPTLPLTAGKLYIQNSPAPSFTCINCTGSADAVDLSQTPLGAPVYSYSKRSYTGGSGGSSINIWGKVISIKINVTVPYTGATSVVNLAIAVSTVSLGSAVIWQPLVNLKVAGLRTITPGGVTGSQTGDSNLSLPDANVWLNGYGPVIANSLINPDISGEPPSGWPTVIVEIQTDQGFPQYLVPLTLKLHS